jgi:hypothetical protein
MIVTLLERGGTLGLAGFGAFVSASLHAAYDPEIVERGEDRLQGIAGCGNCHTRRDDASTLIHGITPDQETGIGAWSDAEIIRAIHEGVPPDGQVLGSPMSFAFYRGMSDRDAQAIVACWHSVPAVTNRVVHARSLPVSPREEQ